MDGRVCIFCIILGVLLDFVVICSLGQLPCTCMEVGELESESNV